VAPFPGTDEIPDVQSSGQRTFGRVIPADDVQAEAAAAWAERLGARRVSTASDGSFFGDTLVTAFEGALTSATVTRRGDDLFYFGGEPHRQPAALLPSFPGRVMVSDAQLIEGAVEAQPTGTLATSAALDPTHLPAAGREFAMTFADEYGRRPGRFAAYGYEAMALVLDAVERAGDEGAQRESVVDAFFETTERQSVLGTYSIDEVGETTLDRMSGYRIVGGAPRPAAELTAP
jgi:branched-chain amino acid transport system substrate-binding protein